MDPGAAIADVWTLLKPEATAAEIALVAAVALIAGVMRGFSGFGSALVVVPVMAAVFGPRLAVPAAIVVHLLTTAQLLPGAFRDVEWGRTLPLSVAGSLAISLGAWALVALDPELIRRGIAILIIVFAVLMLRGWRYAGRVNAWAMGAAGAVGGFITGAATIGGPPVVMFLMAGPYSAAQNRAAIIFYFTFVQAVAVVMYWIGGLLVWQVLGICLLVLPTLALGTWIGQSLFTRASETLFRRVALIFLLAIGVTTLFV